jgi:dTDP-4-dehydrorhamnose reductase
MLGDRHLAPPGLSKGITGLTGPPASSHDLTGTGSGSTYGLRRLRLSAVTTKPILWITGAGGLIGSHLVRAAQGTAWQVVGLTRQELGLNDFKAVRDRFRRDQPAVTIHCAAMGKAADCQRDPAAAKRINVDVTRHLAELAADTPFIFFSTDLVFDGAKGWYVESDPVNPLTVYAETKVIAERVVLENPRHTVIRTGPNVGISPTGDRAFSEELRSAAEQGRPMQLFVDEFRCPVPVVETTRATVSLLERRLTGMFHMAGSERLSRWDIGELLLARWPNTKPQFKRGSIRDFAGPPRSPDTSLNCDKLTNAIGRKLPGLRSWLEAHPNERV